MPLGQTCRNDLDITQEDKIMRNLSCKRLLLEAGADPTIYGIELDCRLRRYLAVDISVCSVVSQNNSLIYFDANSARLLYVNILTWVALSSI